jgi:signal transduction histidine kinase
MESKTFDQMMIEALDFGVVATNGGGDVRVINARARQILNLDLDEINRRPVNILEVVDSSSKLHDELEKVFQPVSGILEPFEISYRGFQLEIIAKKFKEGWAFSIYDVTEKKRLRDAATLGLLKSHEIERQWLAEEIHDGIGPLLSTIRLNLDAVKGAMPDASVKTKTKLDAMDQLIQNVSRDIRDISHSLMPGSLVDFGVVQALGNLCNKADKSELVKVEFRHFGIKERMDPNMELNIYRMAQELLNNALKHANASNISIQLNKKQNSVVLTVDDNGIGINRKSIDSTLESGIGLHSVEARAQLLGGRFVFESSEGKGVLARVEIPLRNKK